MNKIEKEKILKNIMVISIFMIIGAVIGYAVVRTQQSQLTDPEYIKFWADNNMPLPEPLSYPHTVIGFLIMFGGIPTGIIGYSYFLKKYTRFHQIAKPLAVIISIMLFPIYIVIGAAVCIPLLMIQLFVLIFAKETSIRL